METSIDDKEVSKLARQLLSRFEILKQDRKNFEEIWRQCEFAIAPIMQDWDVEKPKTAYKLPERETSFPTSCLNTAVIGIAGYAASATIKWFKLSMKDKAMNQEDGVAQWLEECEKVLRLTFERCQFYKKVIHWLELSAIYGTSTMLIEEMSNSDAPLRYYVPENHEFYVDTNDIGEVERVYRYYWTDAENLINRYGKKAMHKKLLEQYEQWAERKEEGHSMEPIDVQVLHAVELRRSGKPEYGETVAKKKWASYIVDVTNKHVIRESGYDEFPFAMFYWEHNGKPYGISPTIMGMRDIVMYQEAYSNYLMAVQRAANPPMSVPKQGNPHWDFGPGGINQVTALEQAPQPINYANIAELFAEKEKFEQHVKDWFNVDFFIMLRQREGLGQMTATAINAMRGEQVALLSAIVSNLQDGLSKCVERTFNILMKKKLLPEIPFAIQQTPNQGLQIIFQGVLAQAQKQEYEFAGYQDVMAVAGQFAEFGKAQPEFAKYVGYIKPDILFKRLLESRGVPSEILRTEEEYNKFIAGIDEKEEAAAAAEAQAASNQALLQNAKNLNQRAVPGSLLEKMGGPTGASFMR
jgi:hypothetical protein